MKYMFISDIHGNCDTFEFEEMLDIQMLDMDTMYINKKSALPIRQN